MYRLREERKKKHLSLEALSNELSKIGLTISSNSLGKYERGEREPKLKTWKKLADYFGVSVAYLQGINENFSNYDLFVEENRNNNYAKYNEYALVHNIKVDPINKKIVRGWITNIAPPTRNELKVLVGLQDHFSLEEAEQLVQEGKTQDLVSLALPSAYQPTIEDHIRNEQKRNEQDIPKPKISDLVIKDQSLVDILCLVYKQHRKQVSSDFIRNKTNLTTKQKKKILDDFSDLLEREISGDSNK